MTSVIAPIANATNTSIRRRETGSTRAELYVDQHHLRDVTGAPET